MPDDPEEPTPPDPFSAEVEELKKKDNNELLAMLGGILIRLPMQDDSADDLDDLDDDDD
jgi:hypothetical protein